MAALASRLTLPVQVPTTCSNQGTAGLDKRNSLETYCVYVPWGLAGRLAGCGLEARLLLLLLLIVFFCSIGQD